MNGYFRTDKGQVRSHNEDNGGVFVNKQGQLLAVIADGMGGHRAGDVASEIATSSLHKKWDHCELIESPGEAQEWLELKVKEVNEEVFQHAIEHEECKGMGTTIVVAICTAEFVTIAHIGDSRCYLTNEFGFKQVTDDHSLVNELVRSGQITRQDAEHHPRKNVLLKALGTERVITVDINTISWENNNKLLLCSDGLSNKLADEELEEFINKDKTLEDIADEMIYLANDRGGEDNISLVLIDYVSPREEGEA